MSRDPQEWDDAVSRLTDEVLLPSRCTERGLRRDCKHNPMSIKAIRYIGLRLHEVNQQHSKHTGRLQMEVTQLQKRLQTAQEESNMATEKYDMLRAMELEQEIGELKGRLTAATSRWRSFLDKQSSLRQSHAAAIEGPTVALSELQRICVIDGVRNPLSGNTAAGAAHSGSRHMKCVTSSNPKPQQEAFQPCGSDSEDEDERQARLQHEAQFSKAKLLKPSPSVTPEGSPPPSPMLRRGGSHLPGPTASTAITTAAAAGKVEPSHGLGPAAQVSGGNHGPHARENAGSTKNVFLSGPAASVPALLQQLAASGPAGRASKGSAQSKEGAGDPNTSAIRRALSQRRAALSNERSGKRFDTPPPPAEPATHAHSTLKNMSRAGLCSSAGGATTVVPSSHPTPPTVRPVIAGAATHAHQGHQPPRYAQPQQEQQAEEEDDDGYSALYAVTTSPPAPVPEARIQFRLGGSTNRGDACPKNTVFSQSAQPTPSGPPGLRLVPGINPVTTRTSRATVQVPAPPPSLPASSSASVPTTAAPSQQPYPAPLHSVPHTMASSGSQATHTQPQQQQQAPGMHGMLEAPRPIVPKKSIRPSAVPNGGKVSGMMPPAATSMPMYSNTQYDIATMVHTSAAMSVHGQSHSMDRFVNAAAQSAQGTVPGVRTQAPLQTPDTNRMTCSEPHTHGQTSMHAASQPFPHASTNSAASMPTRGGNAGTNVAKEVTTTPPWLLSVGAHPVPPPISAPQPVPPVASSSGNAPSLALLSAQAVPHQPRTSASSGFGLTGLTVITSKPPQQVNQHISTMAQASSGRGGENDMGHSFAQPPQTHLHQRPAAAAEVPLHSSSYDSRGITGMPVGQGSQREAGGNSGQGFLAIPQERQQQQGHLVPARASRRFSSTPPDQQQQGPQEPEGRPAGMRGFSDPQAIQPQHQPSFPAKPRQLPQPQPQTSWAGRATEPLPSATLTPIQPTRPSFVSTHAHMHAIRSTPPAPLPKPLSAPSQRPQTVSMPDKHIDMIRPDTLLSPCVPSQQGRKPSHAPPPDVIGVSRPASFGAQRDALAKRPSPSSTTSTHHHSNKHVPAAPARVQPRMGNAQLDTRGHMHQAPKIVPTNPTKDDLHSASGHNTAARGRKSGRRRKRSRGAGGAADGPAFEGNYDNSSRKRAFASTGAALPPLQLAPPASGR